MTMSGQVDIGWGVMPFGLKEYQDGKFRIIARGSDVPSMRNQTMRVQVVNADALRDRKDVMLRFMRAYRETLDWMYASPEAVKLYAEKMKMPEELVVLQRDQFNPKDAMLPDRLSDQHRDGRRGRAEIPGKADDQGRTERAVPESAGGIVTGFEYQVLVALLMVSRSASRPCVLAARTLSCLPSSPSSRWRATVASAISGSTPSSRQAYDHLLHLVGAADAVARHAFEVVFDHLVRSSVGYVFFSDAATSSMMPHADAARKHSAVSASMPLIMTLRIIFSAAASPTSLPTRSCRASRVRRSEAASRLSRVRPASSSGVWWRFGWIGDQDRDVDIARGAFEQLRGLLLAARRDGIDVEIIGIALEVRRTEAPRRRSTPRSRPKR